MIYASFAIAKMARRARDRGMGRDTRALLLYESAEYRANDVRDNATAVDLLRKKGWGLRGGGDMLENQMGDGMGLKGRPSNRQRRLFRHPWSREDRRDDRREGRETSRCRSRMRPTSRKRSASRRLPTPRK